MVVEIRFEQFKGTSRRDVSIIFKKTRRTVQSLENDHEKIEFSLVGSIFNKAGKSWSFRFFTFFLFFF